MKEMRLMMFTVLVLLAGCKGKEEALELLRAHEWQLESMTEKNQKVKNPENVPTLIFSDSSAVYGSAGCNRFFGKYTAEKNGKISIEPGGATMMYCPDMNFENQYLQALPLIRKFAVDRQKLTMKSGDGQVELVYVPVGKSKTLGVAKDKHGCNAAAGYTWSEVRKDCIRLFEEGIQFSAAAGQDSTLAAYVVFSADSLQAEVFLPNLKTQAVLERRQLPGGGYAWNQEDDDTVNVRKVDGRWVIEQRDQVLYSEVKK